MAISLGLKYNVTKRFRQVSGDLSDIAPLGVQADHRIVGHHHGLGVRVGPRAPGPVGRRGDEARRMEEYGGNGPENAP